MAIIKNTPTIVGGGSGGGKTYNLVKKTVRCEVRYHSAEEELDINLPNSMNRNILDVLKENNNCSLRLYRNDTLSTSNYVDLQPHQSQSDSTKIWFDFTGGLDAYVQSGVYAYMYSATGYIQSTVPNALHLTKVMYRVRMNLTADDGKDFFLKNYASEKCTIADLIWWELEEVTE